MVYIIYLVVVHSSTLHWKFYSFWQQTTNRASRNIQKSQISESELISKV